MEEDQQVSSIGRPSNATSQAWINIEHGEMTLLVGKEKLKLNLHQSIQLTDEEKNCCMWIESSLISFDELAPTIFQEETLEGYKLKTNSFSTKELIFELVSCLFWKWKSSSSRAMRMKMEFWPQWMKG